MLVLGGRLVSTILNLYFYQLLTLVCIQPKAGRVVLGCGSREAQQGLQPGHISVGFAEPSPTMLAFLCT